MLTLDKNKIYQENFEFLKDTCILMMEHYNFMLSMNCNSKEDNKTFQDEFNQFKFYDV